MSRPRWNPRRVMDWTAVLFPLACSVAANTIWAARPVYTITTNEHGTNFLTYGSDLVAIGAGVAVPVLLVLSVERWHAHRGLVDWQWWVRLGAMISVTGVVAAVSWVHTALLLFHHGWETPLAIAGPLGIDGLAVLGTLALWPADRALPAAASEPAPELASTEPAPEPALEPVEHTALHSVADPGTIANQEAPATTDDLSTWIAGPRRDVHAAARALRVRRRSSEPLDDLRARLRDALEQQEA